MPPGALAAALFGAMIRGAALMTSTVPLDGAGLDGAHPAPAPLVNCSSANSGRDDLPTLLAAGVLAYVTETLLHEAAGHGGACLAQAHRVLALAPLWMRCSQTSLFQVAAGPGMNVLAAAGFFLVLRLWRSVGPALGMLLWLSFAFNALVACGYLGVGAATGFGDWPVIFGATPFWRVPAMLAAVSGYYLCLRVAAALYVRLAGSGAPAARALRRRALLPAGGAAIVACLAEIVGGRIGVMPLLLAFGCTAVVGYSLTSMDDVVAQSAMVGTGLRLIPRSSSIIAIGILVAAAFVFVVGPGLTFAAP
jgi:hypothetical protein